MLISRLHYISCQFASTNVLRVQCNWNEEHDCDVEVVCKKWEDMSQKVGSFIWLRFYSIFFYVEVGSLLEVVLKLMTEF